MSRYRYILLYVFITFCWFQPLGSSIYGQDAVPSVKQDSTGAAKKKVKKEDGKAIEVKLSFKKLFHKNDSTKLAKRYFRWHNNLIRTGKNQSLIFANKDLKDSIPPKDGIELTKEVLGWYPYWMEPNLHKYLDYSLLKTIAYFDYRVNPRKGEPLTIHDWKTTPMIDSAKANNINVLLTITNFGIDNNSKFLSNSKAKETLIDRVIELLDMRSADGICLDFEGIHSSQKNNYTNFVVLISERLKKHNNDFLVYLAVPAVDSNNILDFDALMGKVDQFVIMGYDYFGSTSKIAGPVAPLNTGDLWEPYSLTKSVNWYLGKKIPPSQIILALPFYGNIWDTKTSQRGSKSRKFNKAITFDAVESFLAENDELEPRIDLASNSSWLSYFGIDGTIKDNRQLKQLWYDSEKNMEQKFDLIIKKDLNGLGIWALGYNKKSRNYWSIIKKSFSKPEIRPPLPPPNYKYPDSIRIIIAGDKKVEDGSGEEVVTAKDSIFAKLGEIDKNLKKVSQSVAHLSNIEKPEKKKKSLLVTFRTKLAEFGDIVDTYGNSRNLTLIILSFIAFFGGLGFIVSLFQKNIRLIFLSGRYLIFFIGIMVLSLLAILTNNTISKLAMLVIGFTFGAIGIFFINKILVNNYKNLP